MSISVPTTYVDVIGDKPFPVRRIYCVGRNYRAHAIEMGSDPDREFPFFFMKPSDAIVANGETIAYPTRTNNFHYEGELVVAIGGTGKNVAPEAADSLIYGYAVGLDMTRRDLQTQARENGRPWDMAKGFDQSAPTTAIKKFADTGPISDGKIALTVNGVVKQSSDISQLTWNVREIIADLSTYVVLQPGDLIYTGTPEGVGPVSRGDVIIVTIAGLPDLKITIGA
jgi:fumarylpyruvate hydrolase